MASPPPLLSLPNELLYNIFSRLSAPDLALVSGTCRVLYHVARDDRLWLMLVQDNVPGVDVAATPLPWPLTSFRELYLAHHPHWFVARHKLWIGSEGMAGRIVIARYDPRRACIEGYQLLAVKQDDIHSPDGVTVFTDHDLILGDDEYDPQLGEYESTMVRAYSFTPDIHLHMDRTVVHLDPWMAAAPTTTTPTTGPRFTVINTDAPHLRPPRPSPSSESNDNNNNNNNNNNPPASPWVAPIIFERSAPPSGRVVRQFMHARALPPQAVCAEGTFALAPDLRAAAVAANTPQPLIIPSDSIFAAHEQNEHHHERELDPRTYERLDAVPYLTVPPPYTTAARDLDHIHMPYGIYNVWPPPNVPAVVCSSDDDDDESVQKVGRQHRVRRLSTQERHPWQQHNNDLLPEAPRRVAEASDRAFYVCSWMDTQDDQHQQHQQPPAFAPVLNEARVVYSHMQTFSTIDPYYYTPTAAKPFRGIWVGDYGGHGCEFLLVHQPDQPGIDDVPLDIAPQDEDETDAEYAARRHDAFVYRGSLEAIKLTGDPNVPAGEYSFVAGDLSASWAMRKGPYAGAHMVDSAGHVAGHGFRNDRFVETRLIVVSADCLAQFWVGSGYINYFHRVDIDRFTRPF